MIPIISGTNRINSNTLKVANICQEILQKESQDSKIIDLKVLSSVSLGSDMYNADNQDDTVAKIQDEYLLTNSKWIIIVPEYNGGLPGIFKLFIDILSTRLRDQTFYNKTALLVGVAAGRAGNARGLDYLTNCLHYLGMNVLPSKLPISSINRVMDDEGALDESTTAALSAVITKLIKA